MEVAVLVVRYLLNHLFEDISVSSLEREIGYNKFYLIRLFKMYTGYTIKEFINTVKVLKTVDPLIFTDDTILKIALSNGFHSQEYYSEKFRDVIGISPLQFRKEYMSIEKERDIERLKGKREYLVSLHDWEKGLVGMAYGLDSGYVKELKKKN